MCRFCLRYFPFAFCLPLLSLFFRLCSFQFLAAGHVHSRACLPKFSFQALQASRPPSVNVNHCTFLNRRCASLRRCSMEPRVPFLAEDIRECPSPCWHKTGNKFLDCNPLYHATHATVCARKFVSCWFTDQGRVSPCAACPASAFLVALGAHAMPFVNIHKEESRKGERGWQSPANGLTRNTHMPGNAVRLH